MRSLTFRSEEVHFHISCGTETHITPTSKLWAPNMEG
jgi:hypothetical protein